MSETLHDRPILFRRLRILQLSTVSFIFFLEIIQIIAFIGEFETTRKPLSFYFSTSTFDLCGIKLLYHIVIVLSLIINAYYFMRFTHRWYHGPYQTDIIVDLTLFYLWITTGITNIFPLLKGVRWECRDNAFGPNVHFLARVLCDGYFFSTILGWIMIIEFFASTILYLRLWKTRNYWDKNLNVSDGDSEKAVNLENEINNDENVNEIQVTSTPNERHLLELNLGPRSIYR